MKLFAAAAIIMGLALPASAEATLNGRIVTFRVLAYDDPAHPLFEGKGATVRVTDAVEFGLHQEGAQNGLDVIPVEVNISDRRIEVLYPGPDEAVPLSTAFNGYVLTFDTDCALFQGAKVDPAGTNIALTDEDVTWDRGTLMINVTGLRYVSGAKFAIVPQVTDCPLS